MEVNYIGTISIPDGLVDISDPAYNREIWCRLNDMKIIPGTYECRTYVKDTGEWGKRVCAMEITKADIDISDCNAAIFQQHVGEIGVDGGQAGFWNHKPDFIRDDYLDTCVDMESRFGRIYKNGFIAESGYGDGGYPVYARKYKGNIYQLTIKFIEDEE